MRRSAPSGPSRSLGRTTFGTALSIINIGLLTVANVAARSGASDAVPRSDASDAVRVIDSAPVVLSAAVVRAAAARGRSAASSATAPRRHDIAIAIAAMLIASPPT